MKSIALSLLLFVSLISFGQAPPISTDSLGKLVSKGDHEIVSTISSSAKSIVDTMGKALSPHPVPKRSNQAIETLLVFLPIASVFIIIIIAFSSIKKGGYKLADFLVDKEVRVAMKQKEVDIINARTNAIVATANAIKANAAAYAAANQAPPAINAEAPVEPPPVEDGDKSEKSTSRLIAFLTGVSSLVLAGCITGYYFYRTFSGDANVSIGNLANVLYGLGLGVLPYGFSKISNALK